MKKVLVVTGTRADYGIYVPILEALMNAPDFEVELLVTGMHLSPLYGMTVNAIKEDGYIIAEEVDILLQNPTHENMANSVGLGIVGFTPVLKRVKPDFLMILGDRGEMLAAAIAGSHMNIPVVHFHGGEVSGTIDESVRHAISKLSHLHFAATEGSYERLVKMGEDAWRIHVVGAPRIETIKNTQLPTFEEIKKKYHLEVHAKEYILFVYHPVTTSVAEIDEELREIAQALKEENRQIIIVMPNSDTGNDIIREAYKKYFNELPITFVDSFNHLDYLTVLSQAYALIGNSSSGIIEAASFKVPVINIGSRQFRRERSKNILDIEATYLQVMNALQAIKTASYQKQLEMLVNAYGEGNTSDKVLNVLRDVTTEKALLQKTIAY